MERTMTAANVLCSTCVFMKPGIIIIIMLIMFIYTIIYIEEEIGSRGSQAPYDDQFLYNNIEEEIGSQASYNDQFPKKCVQCIQAIQSALPNV